MILEAQPDLAHHWVSFELEGSKDRLALNARVYVTTGDVRQMDEIRSGGSYLSQSDLRLHFGIGGAEIVDLVEVKWPTTQTTERFTGIKANQILTIREGSGIVSTFQSRKS